MVEVEYWHVDVFSRYACQGNGLVVVRDDAGLSTAVQQQLTREVRQFETAFLSEVDQAGRAARLRIFTEDEELGFAGHPVLGAGSALHTELADAAAEEIWALRLGTRTVPVRTRGGNWWVDTSMDQGPADLGRVCDGGAGRQPRDWATCPCRSSAQGDLPLQVVSTGLPYLIVPVSTGDLTAAHIARPDFEALLAESGASDRPGPIHGPAEHIEVRYEPGGDGHLWVGGPVAAPVARGRFHARLAD